MTTTRTPTIDAAIAEAEQLAKHCPIMAKVHLWLLTGVIRDLATPTPPVRPTTRLT